MSAFRNIVFAFCLLITSNAFSQKSKFEFIYKYKGDGANTYISAENLFIRDELAYPTHRVKIKLNKQERLQILNKVEQLLELLDTLKNNLIPDTALAGSIEPCDEASLTIYIDGKERTLQWTNCVGYSNFHDAKAQKTLELLTFIDNIIKNKTEYKKLEIHSFMRM